MIEDLARFLARPGVVDAAPYDATHHDAAWRLQGYDRLMSNECPLPPSPRVLDAAREALEVCNLYPNSGEDVRVATYAFFETQTRLCGGTPVLVPLRDDWSLDTDGLLAAVTPRTKVIFLCSPNNPTGNGWTTAELKAVLAPGVPVVVDQAYLECGHAESFAPLVERHPNLVVTRTFSKAFGLAALRIGYGVMHPDLADAALRLRIPFSLGLPALGAAAAALADPADIEVRREFISSERERVFAALTRLEGVEPYPSEGNFILMNVAASRRSNDEIIRLAHDERILLR